MAAQNLILWAFLTEKCCFPGFGPPAEGKKCDERVKPPKLKIQILTLPKYFTPPPICIFEP